MTVGLEVFRGDAYTVDDSVNTNQMLYELHDEVTFTFNQTTNHISQRYMYQEIPIKPYTGAGVPIVAIQAKDMRNTSSQTYILVSCAALQTAGIFNKVVMGIISLYNGSLNRSMKIRVYTPILRSYSSDGFGLQINSGNGDTMFSSDRKLMNIGKIATASGRYTREVNSTYTSLVTHQWTDLVTVYAMFNYRIYNRAEGLTDLTGTEWVVTSNFCQSILTSDTIPYDQGFANYRILGFYSLHWPESQNSPETYDVIPFTIDFWFDTISLKGEMSDWTRFGFLCTVDS